MGRPLINAYIYSSSSFSPPLSPISPIVCGIKNMKKLPSADIPCLHGFGRAVAVAALLTGGLWFLGPSNEGLLSVSSRKKRASSPPSVCLPASQLDSILHLRINAAARPPFALIGRKKLIKSQLWLKNPFP